MELKKYIGSFKSILLLCLCVLAICYFCISCSNGKKVSMDKSTMAESVQIELDLIENFLRDYILDKKNIDIDFRDLTLKTLEGQRRLLDDGNWLIGRWWIEKVSSQEPIAHYSVGSSITSWDLTLYLYKQNGVYKLKHSGSEHLDLEEIEEYEQ